MRPIGPVARVRARLAHEAGDEIASRLPDGYQRMGEVVLVRLPPSLRDWSARIGEWYREELRARTVLQRSGPVEGEWRLPSVEVIAGPSGPTEVVEHGIRFRFDPERVMFARGNREERHRAGRLTQPGETVVDLFAGIGYFSIPAAVLGRADRVIACEANPIAHAFLVENARINGVAGTVEARLGDNRRVPLPEGEADRVFLGYLPSSLSLLPLAIRLLRPGGGWLHVHLVAETTQPLTEVETTVRGAGERAGAKVEATRSREVKPYGPGRRHIVVDARAVRVG